MQVESFAAAGVRAPVGLKLRGYAEYLPTAPVDGDGAHDTTAGRDHIEALARRTGRTITGSRRRGERPPASFTDLTDHVLRILADGVGATAHLIVASAVTDTVFDRLPVHEVMLGHPEVTSGHSVLDAGPLTLAASLVTATATPGRAPVYVLALADVTGAPLDQEPADRVARDAVVGLVLQPCDPSDAAAVTVRWAQTKGGDPDDEGDVGDVVAALDDVAALDRATGVIVTSDAAVAAAAQASGWEVRRGERGLPTVGRLRVALAADDADHRTVCVIDRDEISNRVAVIVIPLDAVR